MGPIGAKLLPALKHGGALRHGEVPVSKFSNLAMTAIKNHKNEQAAKKGALDKQGK